jgi:tRNA nucleotidyltransferase (CCA-adding enzyme)
MEVITTHTNADFDAFASMLAAKKLYPGALLVFSGSQEKALREALKTIPLPEDIKIHKIKEIDIDAITTLILVDVRHPGRLGSLAHAALRDDVELHIYDHHRMAEGDLRGAVDVSRPYGSTTTVLALILSERGIELSSREATLLMAGIYEDTGSLTFPSTTVSDYRAASFLLESGADLAAVSGMLRKELTPEEVSLLGEFLESKTVFTVSGADITVAEGYLEKNIGDISVLAHKMQELEGMETLFMLVDSVDRVHVIARSRAPLVDVGLICSELGGGGHPNAASATVKGITLIQARACLAEALKKLVIPGRTAADMMSFPVKSTGPEAQLNDTVEQMLRYNVNAMPVEDSSGVLGVITRQVAAKAVFHGLGASPVSDYMTTECETVETVTSIDEIREKVIGHGQRLLPVLEGGELRGVITRTDLIKLLQEELRERPGRGRPRQGRILDKLMRELLPAWAVEILKEAGETAEELGMRAYIVGGIARDLLMRRKNLDIDIVVEGGDGIEFAREFAHRRGLRVRTHQRFKTAVLIFPDGFKVDVATARLEYYERPGALPTVEQSSLKLDLYRRDFIINTLAVGLNPGHFGELTDFYGAQKDIKDRTIRVIHNLSFVEDPTRALRAVRFSVKFGFKIGAHTLKLIKNALKQDLFDHISGARILDELRHIFEEELAAKAVAMLDELGLLSLIDGKITWDDSREALFARAHEAVIWQRLLYTEEDAEEWLVLLLALTDELTEAELAALAERLTIAGKRRLHVISSRGPGLDAVGRGAGLDAVGRINGGLAASNSALYELLSPIPLEVILYLMARAPGETVKMALSGYVTKLKHTETALMGRDLIAMGVPEGPLVGEILAALFKKRLDAEIATREEEEALVREFLKGR